MTVTLTSPVLGQAVGTDYTGTLEDWLLTQGYAKRAGYTGPGVSNTGVTDVVPDKDPTLAENREQAPWFPAQPVEPNMANDVTNLAETNFPVAFDFDEGGVDDDAPVNLVLEPVTGPAAGGTEVTIVADSLEGATGVTFDGVAGTSFTLAADGNSATVVTPVGTTGPADVIVTGDPSGVSATLTGGFTYTA